jgi:Flp pilus assembly protein TadG
MHLHRDSGAAAVEFALVSSLLFLLLFGMITFGIGLFQQQSVVQAAREGARLASVGWTGTCADFRTAVRAHSSVKIDSVALDLPDGNLYGKPLTVTVHYTFDLSLIGWVPFVNKSVALTNTATAMIEQPMTGETASGCAAA